MPRVISAPETNKLTDTITETNDNGVVLTDNSAPVTAPINQPIRGTPRRGRHYDNFVDKGLAKAVSQGSMTQMEAAEYLDVSQRTISGYLAYYIDELRNGNIDDKWRLNSKTAQLLKPENFPAFREKFFSTHTGKPYITKPFHMRWIKSILNAIEHGGKLTILSPPRHGKTELLVHFVIWLIIKNPNIRILWIGGIEDIAEDAVGLVMRELEGNEKLRAAFLPPDEHFKPGGKGSVTWNKNKITVATRTIVLKSATLRALGRGKRILSLDADLIITDDIDDADSVVSPTQRENTRNWWDQNLTTRKEDHTAWVNIGSRQHPDDIHNKTIEDDTWNKIIEQAYNTDCDLPKHEEPSEVPADHKATFCAICAAWDDAGETLFPELRPMRYLMTTMKSIGRRKFSMIYLNVVDDSGVVIFTKKMLNKCRNPNRSILRLDQIPAVAHDPENPSERYTYTHKIGGLDPSGMAGYQAAVVWALNSFAKKMYMMDLENERGGGIAQARETIKMYFDLLELRHWVIEENLYQGGITRDEILMDYCSRNSIQLEGHLTYVNKWDADIGVTATAPLFENGTIDLPYGNEQSQSKTDLYIKQHVVFDGPQSKQAKKKSAASDIVMAGWFPMSAIRRIFTENEEEVEDHTAHTPYPDTMLGDLYQGVA